MKIEQKNSLRTSSMNLAHKTTDTARKVDIPYVPPKILVVDDELLMCASLKALLGGEGYEVHTSNSGKEAIEHLAKNSFDLVLLDIVMPDVSGYQDMRYINIQDLESLVIVMTGQASLESAIEALRSGAYDYLRKPFEHEEFLKTVKNALDQKRLKSEQKQAEEALRETVRRLEVAYEQSIIYAQELNEEIAERKRAQDGLRKAHDRLERGIEERIAKLAKANDQLKLEIKERKKEVAQKNAELESFVHVVSHDLRAPLITVGGFINALRDDFGNMLPEEGQRYFGYIGSAVRKMELLIYRLLDFSRIGRLTENEKEFSFADLVEEALQLLQHQIKARGIEVNVREDLPVIYGERKRLGRVVDELLTNAAKYVGKHNPSPRIDVGVEEQEGQETFLVRDNGIGIDRGQAKRIFEICYYLHRKPGIGIGLAMCKKIVERHGGRIWLESEPGKGSTFYFTLPRKR